MFIQTSQDVLYIVLACAVGLLALALVWLVVESALVLHRVNRLMREVQDKLRKIEAALAGIRDKLEHSAGYLSLLAGAAKQVLQLFTDRREKKKRK